MKVNVMIQSKREESLRSTLIEVAKQVSFPDWDAMHGIQVTREETDLPKKVCVKPLHKTELKPQGSEIHKIIHPIKKNSKTLSSDTGNENIATVSTNQNNTEKLDKDLELCEENKQKITDNCMDSDKISVKQTEPYISCATKKALSSFTASQNYDSAFTNVNARKHRDFEMSLDALRNPPSERLIRTRSDSNVSEKPSNGTVSPNKLQVNHNPKRPFRKKSMSFAGALPIRIEVTEDDYVSTVYYSSSAFKKNQTDTNSDLAMVSNQNLLNEKKSPQTHRKSRKTVEKKVNDPSHYLGRRRGSYNPSYDQTQSVPLIKTRARNQRARSLFVGNSVAGDNFRESLASRLMKVASPALRESFKEENEQVGTDLVRKNVSTIKNPTNENIYFSDNCVKTSKNMDSSSNHDNFQKENVDASSKFKRIQFERRPWEHSHGIIIPTNSCQEYKSLNEKSCIEKNSAYFSVVSNKSHERTRKATEFQVFNSFKNTSNTALVSTDSLKEDKGKSCGDVHLPNHQYAPRKPIPNTKSSSNPESRTLIQRYQRQSRSNSCFGSLQPSVCDAELKNRRCPKEDQSSESSDEEDLTENLSIHALAKKGKLKGLKRLVEDGLDVNVLDEHNWPPIHYALLGGHFNCVAYLLTKGADIRHYSKGRTLKYFK